MRHIRCGRVSQANSSVFNMQLIPRVSCIEELPMGAARDLALFLSFGLCGFDCSLPGLFLLLLCVCLRDPPAFVFESRPRSCERLLSSVFRSDVFTFPETSPSCVMFAFIAACSAYPFAGLLAARSPLMALRQCDPAHAAGVLC